MTHCNHHHHATTEEHIVCEVANNPAIQAGAFFIFTTIVGVIYAKGTAVITNHPAKVAALTAASAYLYFSNLSKNENSKIQQDDSHYDFIDHDHDFEELNMEDDIINNHD